MYKFRTSYEYNELEVLILRKDVEVRIKSLTITKLYGFISRENEKDLFVHFSGLLMDGYKSLTEGDIVSYSIGEGQRGEQAVDVELLQASPLPAKKGHGGGTKASASESTEAIPGSVGV